MTDHAGSHWVLASGNPEELLEKILAEGMSVRGAEEAARKSAAAIGNKPKDDRIKDMGIPTKCHSFKDGEFRIMGQQRVRGCQNCLHNQDRSELNKK